MTRTVMGWSSVVGMCLDNFPAFRRQNDRWNGTALVRQIIEV